MEFPLTTDRLRVRHWRVDDAPAALATYGVADVTGWLTPATDRIGDLPAMRSVLAAWVEAQPNLLAPRGRWAIERRTDDAVVGGLAIRLLPPYRQDLEISFQLRPDQWGHGYATEAARELIRWAFTQDVDELFTVTIPQQRPRDRDHPAPGHGMGRGDHQVLRPRTTRPPDPPGRPRRFRAAAGYVIQRVITYRRRRSTGRKSGGYG